MKNLDNTKITFCPGPGAVIPEWFNHQKEFFGRGDHEYEKIKKKTFNWLKKKKWTGQHYRCTWSRHHSWDCCNKFFY